MQKAELAQSAKIILTILLFNILQPAIVAAQIPFGVRTNPSTFKQRD